MDETETRPDTIEVDRVLRIRDAVWVPRSDPLPALVTLEGEESDRVVAIRTATAGSRIEILFDEAEWRAVLGFLQEEGFTVPAPLDILSKDAGAFYKDLAEPQQVREAVGDRAETRPFCDAGNPLRLTSHPPDPDPRLNPRSWTMDDLYPDMFDKAICQDRATLEYLHHTLELSMSDIALLIEGLGTGTAVKGHLRKHGLEIRSQRGGRSKLRALPSFGDA